MRDIAYKLDEPYPKPEILRKNIKYAKLLLDNYCGAESELTAITQYIYHYLLTEDKSEKISTALRGIAIVEMQHLDMLGGCIRQLGLEPKYRHFSGNRAINWHAGYVYYGTHLHEMINRDIAGEVRSIEGYKKSIELIDNDSINALLRRIIKDEELHIKVLHSLI